MFSRSMFNVFDDFFAPMPRVFLDGGYYVRIPREYAKQEPCEEQPAPQTAPSEPKPEGKPEETAKTNPEPSRTEPTPEEQREPPAAPVREPVVRFSSTTTRTVNGVTETTRTVRGADGKTTSVHSRAIGDRAVELIREDDGKGGQTETRTLIGMHDDDAAKFDDDWAAAARGLPVIGRHGFRRMLENSRA
ncbi:Myeloid leukemia factor [Carpediemonas membranifera]|uniref:Myeloid leukemia factor n=1 Tax=Carpediemonas membranifera TaxID=201153 RepID=A0A8J6B6F3_9EUKA|nr:Myeloid leukemia factor [Carpediemonas membranifera]|eukprot:KAG9396648.1 Myeloid leukemia factor [Carpediemonas membranifera]